jgi:deazaflavin-dependent oxidoreductase (nitroreductase family)
MNIPKQGTLKLTHFGRKSGKPFDVTIWFTEVGGELWIGSLDIDRGWVRNLRATGRARINFGDGVKDIATEFLDDDRARERYSAAIAAKYPILSRIIGLFVRGKKRAVFRVTPA